MYKKLTPHHLIRYNIKLLFYIIIQSKKREKRIRIVDCDNLFFSVKKLESKNEILQIPQKSTTKQS